MESTAVLGLWGHRRDPRNKIILPTCMDPQRLIAIAAIVLALALAYRCYRKERFTGKPRVMMFYATWCKYCKRYRATGLFDRVGAKLRSQIEFVSVDADKQPALVDRYGIKGFPSIILLWLPCAMHEVRHHSIGGYTQPYAPTHQQERSHTTNQCLISVSDGCLYVQMEQLRHVPPTNLQMLSEPR